MGDACCYVGVTCILLGNIVVVMSKKVRDWVHIVYDMCKIVVIGYKWGNIGS